MHIKEDIGNQYSISEISTNFVGVTIKQLQ